MATFTTYNPASDTLAELVSAIFTPAPGVTVQGGSILARYGVPDDEASTISFYDGSTTALNIGAGLLLTSGDPTPEGENTVGFYGVDAGSGDVDAPDADLQAVADAAFEESGEVEDVTWLVFQVNVTDPNLVGLRFEVVFASDEFPEWSDSDYVDVAGVFVNGTNYALFNNNAATPLSVIEENLSGNFRDNESGTIPIEYDGVSVKLQITAPIQQGLNTIKIGVADTGDSDYDSGLFIANVQAVDYTGYGLSQQVPLGEGTTQDSPSNQTYVGTSGDNTVFFGPAGGGLDVFNGFDGLDTAQFGIGFGQVTSGRWVGNVFIIDSGANSTSLVNVERVLLGDGLYAGLDTGLGDNTAGVYGMLYLGFHATPGTALLSQWVARADELGSLGDTGDEIIDTYAPSFSDAEVISYLYASVTGQAPNQQTLDHFLGLLNEETTIGDLYAEAGQIALHAGLIAGVIGSVQLLDHSYF